MNEELEGLINEMSDDEKAAFESTLPDMARLIVERRKEKATASLAAEYKAAMLAAPRGTAGNSLRKAIKERYQRMGLDTGRVHFEV